MTHKRESELGRCTRCGRQAEGDEAAAQEFLRRAREFGQVKARAS